VSYITRCPLCTISAILNPIHINNPIHIHDPIHTQPTHPGIIMHSDVSQDQIDVLACGPVARAECMQAQSATKNEARGSDKQLSRGGKRLIMALQKVGGLCGEGLEGGMQRGDGVCFTGTSAPPQPNNHLNQPSHPASAGPRGPSVGSAPAGAGGSAAGLHGHRHHQQALEGGRARACGCLGACNCPCSPA